MDTQYRAFDRAQFSVLTRAASWYMSSPRYPNKNAQFEMTVARVREVHEHLRRITFTASELATLERLAPDDYFGLIIPPPGRPFVMPAADRVNIRASIAKMDAADRPDVRWYTIAEHRPQAAEIDVDFILHEAHGPGSGWATSATVGQHVGYRSGAGPYQGAQARRQLFVADETALPALRAILEHLDPEVEATVFIEVPDSSFEQPLARKATYIRRGAGKPGEKAIAAVTGAELGQVDYAWLCGEQNLATSLRRHLVRECGVDRRSVLFSGYWRVGKARR